MEFNSLCMCDDLTKTNSFLPPLFMVRDHIERKLLDLLLSPATEPHSEIHGEKCDEGSDDGSTTQVSGVLSPTPSLGVD